MSSLPIRAFGAGLFRGPRPESGADFNLLKGLNFRSVLDLEEYPLDLGGNSRAKVAKYAAETGVQVASLPLGLIMPPSFERLDTAVRLLCILPKPIYVHCYHGVDRTGMVVAAFKSKVLKQPLEKVVDDMLVNGFHFWRYWFWLFKLKAYVANIEAKRQ